MAEAALDNEDTVLGAGGQQNPEGGAPAAGRETGQADAAGDQGAEGATEGAPEAYEAFTLPEGVEVDQGLLERFSGEARELKLSQDQAQRLVNFYTEALTGAQGAMNDASAQRLEQWAADLRADPEFGGAKFEANAQVARAAINQFGDDELRQVLNETGLGNHPALVKFAHRIGKAISEDSVVFGAMGGGQKKSAAEILYPDAT